VLSDRGLCDELITCQEKSYRLWCVVVCDVESSWMRRPWPAGGRRTKNSEWMKIGLSVFIFATNTESLLFDVKFENWRIMGNQAWLKGLLNKRGDAYWYLNKHVINLFQSFY